MDSTNNFMSKSIISKKTLALRSLSQHVKIGCENFYLVEMINKTGNERFYSWQNKFVIEKYFGLDEQQFSKYAEAGKEIEEKNQWPTKKPEAIKQIMSKFMQLEVEQIVPINQQEKSDNSEWGNFVGKTSLITKDQNQKFKQRMARQADKEKNNMEFYIIKGFHKDYYTGQVFFYVQDQTGELKQKTLEELKKNNLLQVVSYLESKIVGYKR